MRRDESSAISRQICIVPALTGLQTDVTSFSIFHLPSIEFGGREFSLPTPARDLVRFCAAVSGEDSARCLALLKRTFLGSPALLIYAVFRAKESRGSLVERMDELVDWINSADSLFQSELEVSLLPHRYVFARDAVVSARQNPSKLRKHLKRWLQQVTGYKKKPISTFVNELFPPQLVESYVGFLDEDFEIDSDDLSWLAEDIIDEETVQLIWQSTAASLHLRNQFQEQLRLAKLNSLQQLAYGASHEINNPLANIASRAQALMLGEENADRKYGLAKIYSQAMRAHEMISDMMLFAKPPKLQKTKADLKEIVQKQIHELGVELKCREIKIEVRQYPDVVRCHIDTTAMGVVFKALIQNSIDAIGVKGHIRIRIWRKTDNLLSVEVVDNGAGIPQQNKNHLFDPYFSGREAGRGIGFGLPKAWRILRQHGGNLTLDETFEDGARFLIEVPVNSASNHGEGGTSSPARFRGVIDKRAAA